MSDGEDTGFDPDKTMQVNVSNKAMTDRLASLRASILASKTRSSQTGDAESGEDEDHAEVPSDLKHTNVMTREEISEAVDVDAPLPISEAHELGDDISDEVSFAPLPLADVEEEDEPETVVGDVHLPAFAATPEAVETHDPPDADAEEEEDNPTQSMAPLSEETRAAAAAYSDDLPEFKVEPTVVKRITDVGSVNGTPLYMSPEQIRGESLGPATDVYSFGVMLFELLEGHPPFDGASVEEVLLKHQDSPVPEQGSEFTPDEIRDLVARMMAKDAAERPTTAEIIQILQRHVQIGGPDVDGLEEESWTVDEIETATVPSVAPVQWMGPSAESAEPQAATDGAPDEARKLPIVPIIAIAALLSLVAIGAIMASGGDEQAAEAEVAVEEPGTVDEASAPTPPEEAPEELAAEEPAPPDEEVDNVAAAGTEEEAAVDDENEVAEGFEFGKPETDDATGEELPAEEPVEERTAVAEKEPTKKTTQKPRRKKKKQKKLRELRLDL